MYHRLQPRGARQQGQYGRPARPCWQFWTKCRVNAKEAQPNLAHFALAELAKKREYLAISQNIDYLCERARHPSDSLVLFHGCMFNLTCMNPVVPHRRLNHRKDPIVQALKSAVDGAEPRTIAESDLPWCREKSCGHLLRPDVVMYGENPSERAVARVDTWFKKGSFDLMLVIGTSALVAPVDKYIQKAKARGSKIAVVNIAEPPSGAKGKDGEVELDAKGEAKLNSRWAGIIDCYFRGDANQILTALLREVVGSLDDVEEDPLAVV